jgi:hopanoid biosynthesis associated protein HpnK
MARPDAARRLVVNADDFGRSSSVNHAVLQAHRDGILTTASLMVNEPGCDEAVAMARENPRLGVGLHLGFSHGHSALPPEKIPGLVNARGEFSNRAGPTGFRYFLRRGLHEQLRRELHAQFEKFRATGLPLDHVNGHLHFHLHPVIFRILMADASRLGIRRMRLTRDPFWLNARLAGGGWLYRINHAIIFGLLAARSRPWLDRQKIQYARNVFGLLQNGRVDEAYVERLLSRLPPGDSELYSHPSLDEFKREYEALISPRIRQLINEQGIQLIRYQDL